LKQHFKNAQWSVTEEGLQCLDPKIIGGSVVKTEELADLLEGHEDQGVARWPVHYSEKSWVNMDAFMQAFRHALEVHAPAGREKINWLATVEFMKSRSTPGS
jgi:hypothetical protein